MGPAGCAATMASWGPGSHLAWLGAGAARYQRNGSGPPMDGSSEGNTALGPAYSPVVYGVKNQGGGGEQGSCEVEGTGPDIRSWISISTLVELSPHSCMLCTLLLAISKKSRELSSSCSYTSASTSCDDPGTSTNRWAVPCWLAPSAVLLSCGPWGLAPEHLVISPSWSFPTPPPLARPLPMTPPTP